MSYDRNGSAGKYLIPNIPLADGTAGVMEEMDVGAASADHGEYICVFPCIVKRIGFVVVGEAIGGSGTAPTVVFTKRPTPLSATGESALGTLTLPDTTAIGKVVYKDVNIALAVGDSVEIAHTVGVTGPTGKGFPFLECADDPEYVGNNSDLIASA